MNNPRLRDLAPAQQKSKLTEEESEKVATNKRLGEEADYALVNATLKTTREGMWNLDVIVFTNSWYVCIPANDKARDIKDYHFQSRQRSSGNANSDSYVDDLSKPRQSIQTNAGRPVPANTDTQRLSGVPRGVPPPQYNNDDNYNSHAQNQHRHHHDHHRGQQPEQYEQQQQYDQDDQRAQPRDGNNGYGEQQRTLPRDGNNGYGDQLRRDGESRALNSSQERQQAFVLDPQNAAST